MLVILIQCEWSKIVGTYPSTLHLKTVWIYMLWWIHWWNYFCFRLRTLLR